MNRLSLFSLFSGEFLGLIHPAQRRACIVDFARLLVYSWEAGCQLMRDEYSRNMLLSANIFVCSHRFKQLHNPMPQGRTCVFAQIHFTVFAMYIFRFFDIFFPSCFIDSVVIYLEHYSGQTRRSAPTGIMDTNLY